MKIKLALILMVVGLWVGAMIPVPTETPVLDPMAPVNENVMYVNFPDGVMLHCQLIDDLVLRKGGQIKAVLTENIIVHGKLFKVKGLIMRGELLKATWAKNKTTRTGMSRFLWVAYHDKERSFIFKGFCMFSTEGKMIRKGESFKIMTIELRNRQR